MTRIDATTIGMTQLNLALKEALNGTPVSVSNAGHVHGIAAGFDHGDVVVEGDTGDYTAMLASGVTLRVKGNAGKYAADNMTAGCILVEGNAGFGAAQYCYGGTVVIYGDADDFTATMNKGATIIVAGNVGDEAATYMLNGDLIVVGNAGANFANFLIQGTVYIGGEWQSLGHNTRVDALGPQDIEKLQEYFNTYGIEADPAQFKKVVAASKKPFYK